MTSPSPKDSKPRRPASVKRPPAKRLRLTHPHAAGIDVHSQVHWVAVPPEDAPPPPADHPPNLPAHVRAFGTCTADLIALAEWLRQCGVQTIAGTDGQCAGLVPQPC